MMHLKVGTKITIGFFVLTLLILVLGGISYYSSGGIKEQVTELERATARLTLSLKVENEFTGAIGEARGYVAYGNEKMIDNFSNKVKKTLEIEKQILEVTDESQRSVVDKLMNDTAEYMKGTDKEFVPAVREQVREQKAGNTERMPALQAHSTDMGKKYVPFAEGVMKGSHELVEENTKIVNSRLEVIKELVKRAVFNSAVLALLAVLIAGVLTISIPRDIKKSLQIIMASTKRYAGGDLRETISVRKQDEFGEIGEAINQMVAGIKHTIEKIVHSSTQMTVSSEELTANADQSAQASSQVAGAIMGVAKGAEEQLAAANEASLVVEQMSASIKQAAASASEVVDQSVQAADKANKGLQSVDTAVNQMTHIEQTVAASAEVVAKLGERSKEIGQIVDAIASIAGQTNLLALNAAIEAARAGEQGRGFAVVAEEVRKLAEQSQEAAKQIADLIGEIQSDTDKAVTSMNNGTKEVKVGAEVVNASGHAFHEITSLVNNVSEQVTKISAAIEQMAVGSQQIVGSVKKIDELNKKSSGEVQTVSAATEEQSASVEEIASSSQALAQLAQELQTEVNKFQI
ncbi:MAG: methyl-accepting chemotaxis protein [Pelosinus sp.]|nr:methyl-accepting chemotaxis protein [Pelosinus sp.]